MSESASIRVAATTARPARLDAIIAIADAYSVISELDRIIWTCAPHLRSNTKTNTCKLRQQNRVELQYCDVVERNAALQGRFTRTYCGSIARVMCQSCVRE